MEDQKITFCEIFAENMFNSSADVFLIVIWYLLRKKSIYTLDFIHRNLWRIVELKGNFKMKSSPHSFIHAFI